MKGWQTSCMFVLTNTLHILNFDTCKLIINALVDAFIYYQLLKKIHIVIFSKCPRISK